MNQSLSKFLGRARVFLNRIEDSVLVGLLLLMIVMAVTQIVLRNLFQFGIVWSDGLVRVLVLWIGLIGAMVASRQGNHINIDLIARNLPRRAQNIVNSIVELFTALVCSLVAYFSLAFVKMEYEDGLMAFARVPAWVCEAIIPFAFTVIAFRYFILSIIDLLKINTTDEA